VLFRRQVTLINRIEQGHRQNNVTQSQRLVELPNLYRLERGSVCAVIVRVCVHGYPEGNSVCVYGYPEGNSVCVYGYPEGRHVALAIAYVNKTNAEREHTTSIEILPSRKLWTAWMSASKILNDSL